MAVPVGALYGVGQSRLRRELTKEGSAPALMAGFGALTGLGSMWRHQHLERTGERFLGDLDKMTPELRRERQLRRFGELAAATAAGAGIGTGAGYGLRYLKGQLIDTARGMGKAIADEAVPAIQASWKNELLPAARAQIDDLAKTNIETYVVPQVARVEAAINNAVPQAEALKTKALSEIRGAIAAERSAAINQAREAGQDLLQYAGQEGAGLLDLAAVRGEGLLGSAAGHGAGLVDHAALRGTSLVDHAAVRGTGLLDHTGRLVDRSVGNVAVEGERLLDLAALRGTGLLDHTGRLIGQVDQTVQRAVQPANRAMDGAASVAAVPRKAVSVAQTDVPGLGWLPSFMPKFAESEQAYRELAQQIEAEKIANVIMDGERAAALILLRM